jgi:hypothetical protein
VKRSLEPARPRVARPTWAMDRRPLATPTKRRHKFAARRPTRHSAPPASQRSRAGPGRLAAHLERCSEVRYHPARSALARLQCPAPLIAPTRLPRSSLRHTRRPWSSSPPPSTFRTSASAVSPALRPYVFVSDQIKVHLRLSPGFAFVAYQSIVLFVYHTGIPRRRRLPAPLPKSLA